MRIYGITGKMHSGKDSFFHLISRRLPAHRLAFGDELKAEVAVACGVTTAEINDRKELYRPILQWWGTDFRRGQNPDYWVQRVQSHLRQMPAGAIVFITDVRFANEADMVRQMGGRIIGVSRPGYQQPAGTAAHASETALAEIPVDDLIVAADMAALQQQAEEWLDRHFP